MDTFESHPFRVVDAASGATLHEHVSQRGSHLVRLDPLRLGGAGGTAGSTAGSAADSSSAPAFDGFDGIGGREGEYVAATVQEIGLDHLGGVVLVAAGAPEFPLPVPVAVGINDAAQLFHAAGGARGGAAVGRQWGVGRGARGGPDG